jgi:hypothetical protein
LGSMRRRWPLCKTVLSGQAVEGLSGLPDS